MVDDGKKKRDSKQRMDDRTVPMQVPLGGTLSADTVEADESVFIGDERLARRSSASGPGPTRPRPPAVAPDAAPATAPTVRAAESAPATLPSPPQGEAASPRRRPPAPQATTSSPPPSFDEEIARNRAPPPRRVPVVRVSPLASGHASADSEPSISSPSGPTPTSVFASRAPAPVPLAGRKAPRKPASSTPNDPPPLAHAQASSLLVRHRVALSAAEETQPAPDLGAPATDPDDPRAQRAQPERRVSSIVPGSVAHSSASSAASNAVQRLDRSMDAREPPPVDAFADRTAVQVEAFTPALTPADTPAEPDAAPSKGGAHTVPAPWGRTVPAGSVAPEERLPVRRQPGDRDRIANEATRIKSQHSGPPPPLRPGSGRSRKGD